MAFAMHNNIQRLPLRQHFPAHQTNAVWDWKNPTTYSEEALRETAEFLFQRQLNTVFLDITVYTQFALIENSEQKNKQILELETSIERYISAMSERGIRVFASSGHTDWSMPQNQAIPLAIQSFVHDYNNKYSLQFSGIEFDIESYNQQGFTEASFTEKELVLLEFLDLVDTIAEAHTAYVTSSGQTDFELGFAVPYWFDNTNQNIRSVSWQDKTGPVLYHLLDRLNGVNRSNIVVMAYRDAALGNDGIIFHSRTEIEYAQSRAPSVEIIIGLETADVEPEKITFYGKSLAELSSEYRLVSEEFEGSGVLGGIAINDLEGLKDL
jgi:hypothetical protein